MAVGRRVWSKRALAITGAWVALGALVAAGLSVAGGVRGAGVAEPVAAVGRGLAVAAPPLRGRDPITGRYVSLAQFAGRPVVVNVWASWCPGCNREASAMARFAASHPGVQVLGIDMQDTVAGARGFYRKWGWHQPSIADPSGTLAASLAVTGLPTTLFLNSQHRIVARIVGASNLAGFDRGLRMAQSGVRG